MNIFFKTKQIAIIQEILRQSYLLDQLLLAINAKESIANLFMRQITAQTELQEILEHINMAIFVLADHLQYTKELNQEN